MASTAVPADQADQIFRIGPEDLVAGSSSIVSGRVSLYAQEVQKYSQPGKSGLPLEWIARGQINRPTLLKGTAPPAPIRFSRAEHSRFQPTNSAISIWEESFGELSPDGQVVLFFGKEDSVLKVLPSGSDQQNLVALVGDIVAIQAIPDPARQRQSWAQYLGSAGTEEGREAAMRSLVRAGADWTEMEVAFRALFAQTGLSGDARTFAFSFVAFHVTQGTWGNDVNQAVELLCQTFSTEKNPKQQLRYLQSFKLILVYAVQVPQQKSRQPLKQSVAECLRAWASPGISDPAVAQEYKQIRSQFP
jgi:hypothetical protein